MRDLPDPRTPPLASVGRRRRGSLRPAAVNGRRGCRDQRRQLSYRQSIPDGNARWIPARLAAAARDSPALSAAKHWSRPSQPVEWTPNSKPASIQHVQLRHRRADVGMPEQLLHRANVVSVLEQMGRERMPEAVRPHALRDAGPPHRARHLPLHRRTMAGSSTVRRSDHCSFFGSAAAQKGRGSVF